MASQYYIASGTVSKKHQRTEVNAKNGLHFFFSSAAGFVNYNMDYFVQMHIVLLFPVIKQFIELFCYSHRFCCEVLLG